MQRNLLRQVARPTTLRIGFALELDLFGPGGKPYFLAAALGQSRLSLGPQGTFLLDPASAVFLGGAQLDAAGKANLEIPVPGNPALIGFSVYWQAAVGGAARATNLEITTLTNL